MSAARRGPGASSAPASGEFERIARIAAALGAPDARVHVGIGDDAAVLEPPREPLVWTIDAAVEGVHFRRDWMSLADVGYRATMAAASDLAAMGATPTALLAALVLPGSFSDADLDALVSGQREAADALGAPIVGGNLSRGGELSITTTALGHAPAPMTRAGARPGDAIAVAGPLGLAGAGRRALELGVDGARIGPALAAFRRPVARIADGLLAASVAHAAIDVSDGLAADVGHLACASDVTIVLDAAALISPELAAAAAAAAGADAIDLALRGGEDYALLVALPPGAMPEGFRSIGRAEPAGPSTVVLQRAGRLEPLAASGYDHFRR